MRGKRIAFSIAALAVACLSLSVVVFKDALWGQWYIYQLSSDSDERRIQAAEKLAEMKSVRAVPHLLAVVRRDEREVINLGRVLSMGTFSSDGRVFTVSSEGWQFSVVTPILHAVYKIGPTALPAVEAELQREKKVKRRWTRLEDGGWRIPCRPTRVQSALQNLKDAWKSPDCVVERAEYEVLVVDFLPVDPESQRDP